MIFIFIEINNVSKSYGQRLILDHISVNVKKGQFVTLLGSSGCGKTTLLNTIAGLTDIDSGSISVNGSVWSSNNFTMSPEYRNIGMVFQDFALWPHMSIFENIAFALKLNKKRNKMSKLDIKSRVSEVLQVVQMNRFQHYYPHQLSGGQKQRIAVARALAPNPFFLLMDEPLSSLDAKMREKMRWELLQIVKNAGITTIYVTHDQIEALSMSDNVILLNNGRIEQEDNPVQLYEKPKSAFTASFLGASNLLEGDFISHSGSNMLIGCSGFNILASPIQDITDKINVMIRPTDILVDTDYDGVATKLSGRIRQRAFQGTSWQYKVEIHGTNNILLDVCSKIERPDNSNIRLCIPASICHIVKA